jgi:hypothetical protein
LTATIISGVLFRFKRIALRCAKTARNYASFLALVCGFILIKSVHTAKGFRHPNMISAQSQMILMPRPRRIEGYAIVSEDGMLANAAGIMPDSLKFEADQLFFERGLDGVDVVVHGRHSHERQPPSYLRRRLILTRQVPAIAADKPQQPPRPGVPDVVGAVEPDPDCFDAARRKNRSPELRLS